MMENFCLSDEEQNIFGELFSSLDIDKQATLSFKTVSDFLYTCSLNESEISKIYDICGAKRLGHFGRSQFYIALKLVALAQSSYELNLENLNQPNLPLPKINNTRKNSQDFTSNSKKNDKNEKILSFMNSTNSCYLPPPPSSAIKSTRKKNRSNLCKSCNNKLSSDSIEETLNHVFFEKTCEKCKTGNLNSQNNLTLCNFDNNDQSDTEGSVCLSIGNYEMIEDDDNLNFDKLKTWEKIERDHLSKEEFRLSSPDEAKHCLINNDDDEIIANNTDLDIISNDLNSNPTNFNNNYSLFNEKNTIEEESEEEIDVWLMSDEQINFYFKKFLELLPNKEYKFLIGNQVKYFFEKSKLPLNELKKIWNLSDIDNDGKLSVYEFCIAMHLVVLRRNKVSLPEKLPKSLELLEIKKLILKNNLSLNENLNNTIESKISNENIASKKEEFSSKYDSLIDENFSSFSSFNRKWTKFNNSPQTENSIKTIHSSVDNLLSIANFDKIELNPKILHPVALKASPSNTSSTNISQNKDFFQISNINTSLNSQPPPYPPRLKKISGHARSSSLDLSKANSNVIINSNHGAFINYRKHIQQQQDFNYQNMKTSNLANKQHFLKILKSKYKLPTKTDLELDKKNINSLLGRIYCLEEQACLFESLYEKLLEELATALEQLAIYQKNNCASTN